MRFFNFNLKNTLAAAALGFVTLVSVGSVSGQNRREEYREWQRAQRQAQEEYYDCMRTGRRSDCRDYRQAQRRANQELREYQRSNNGYRNNHGYYNNRRVYGQGQVYRVYRNGGYYQTDYRGAELLRQAVNQGYQYGYRQGQQASRYGRGAGYYTHDNYYNNGLYGYQSYVDRNQYQYYFQQGFQRGYEDGYNRSLRYGYRSGNNYNILGTILSTILNFSQ
ncbi:MAG: hypothetical protein ABR535_09930 [Pyrinomonadaceae bacterium]